ISVIASFYRQSGSNTPGSTFSLTTEAFYYTTSGLRAVSVGFPRIFIGQAVQPGTMVTTQSDSIKVTETQLAVTPTNNNATLTMTITNTTSARIYLALTTSTLSDDRATTWSAGAVSGIQTVSSFYNYANGKSSDFTAIDPSESITVIVSFYRL